LTTKLNGLIEVSLTSSTQQNVIFASGSWCTINLLFNDKCSGTSLPGKNISTQKFESD
jgi:hypothetical protein